MVTLSCGGCGLDLWAEGFACVRKSFATLELAEHEARYLGWVKTEAGRWVCSLCRGLLI